MAISAELGAVPTLKEDLGGWTNPHPPGPLSAFWGLSLQRSRGMRAAKAQLMGMEMGTEETTRQAGLAEITGEPRTFWQPLFVLNLPSYLPEIGTQKTEVSAQHLPRASTLGSQKPQPPTGS
ncbi:hypothetical protein HJG60_009728 [Phyllostomus discolor]|uniref:Uncharacterized protein n=1 Tax=Phyllostomus discolor TaxID=89673 RepID=A0A834B6N3_9CHIR|nr:hypothetical protein HJG60_009728 [Phyllostomus discolor]